MLTIAERFWKHVNKKGPIHPVLKTRCWLWEAYTEEHGYGKFQIGKDSRKAHRVAWWLTHGKWPIPNALHKCDVRACVRPDHLFEGNHSDNMRDRLAKGRAAMGSNNGRAKLSENEVLRIRERYSTGDVSQLQLAKFYGVSEQLIQSIVKKRRWKHL
jgi:hypothetical protein